MAMRTSTADRFLALGSDGGASLEGLDPDALDLLVPRAPRRLVRVVAWLGFGALVLAIAWWAATGRIAPRASVSTEAAGGTGPVFATLAVANHSPAAIRVEAGPEAPRGLRSLGTSIGPARPAANGRVPAGPDAPGMVIPPGHVRRVTAWFAVTDCVAARRAGADELSLRLRFASGPTRWVVVERGAGSDQLVDRSWSWALARRACAAQHKG